MSKKSLTCPLCNEPVMRVNKTGTIHPVDTKTLKVDFEEVPKELFEQYYQCKSCKHILENQHGEIIKDHQQLKEWVKNSKSN